MDLQRYFEWQDVENALKILKTAKNRYEFAMLFDMNGFMENESIPQVFKDLRNKIQA